ncbi:MAG: hypothetical protein ACOCX4_04525 [Planctomycetota bacterium]
MTDEEWGGPVSNDFDGFAEVDTAKLSDESDRIQPLCARCGTAIADPRAASETLSGELCCTACADDADAPEPVDDDPPEEDAVALADGDVDADEDDGEEDEEEDEEEDDEDVGAAGTTGDAEGTADLAETPASESAVVVVSEEAEFVEVDADIEVTTAGGGGVEIRVEVDRDNPLYHYLVDPPEILAQHYLETEAEREAELQPGHGGVRASAQTARLRESAARRTSRRNGNSTVRASRRSERDPDAPKSEMQIRRERHAKFIVYGLFAALCLIFIAVAAWRIPQYLGW